MHQGLILGIVAISVSAIDSSRSNWHSRAIACALVKTTAASVGLSQARRASPSASSPRTNSNLAPMFSQISRLLLICGRASFFWSGFPRQWRGQLHVRPALRRSCFQPLARAPTLLALGAIRSPGPQPQSKIRPPTAAKSSPRRRRPPRALAASIAASQ